MASSLSIHQITVAAVMTASMVQLLRRKLYDTRWLLWGVMLMFLFPYIATTAGWITAEVGWQPWLIYGLMRTTDGPCPRFCFYF